LHVHAFAVRHSGTMRLATHQSAGGIAVGEEEQSGWQITRFGSLAGQFDLAELRANADSLAVHEASPSHIVRADEERLSFLNEVRLELPFIERRSLPTGATGDQNKNVVHQRE